MITAAAADRTDVRASDEGSGPVTLISHPGFDDRKPRAKAPARLRGRFRVLRIARRHYRPDPRPCSTDREAQAVLALALAIGEPMMMTGHSSGGAADLPPARCVIGVLRLRISQPVGTCRVRTAEGRAGRAGLSARRPRYRGGLEDRLPGGQEAAGHLS